MRLAVIADVHGNLPALDAVLADLGDESVDAVVNCGDLLSGAVQPRATVERLTELGLPTVAGNHERQVLTLPIEELGSADRIARTELDPDHLDWLRTLPLTLEVAPGVLAFHGTPTDDLQYLLETVDPAAGPSFVRAASTPEVLDRLGDTPGVRLLLSGHTHTPRSMLLPDGRLVVNPGSVGWPAYDDDQPSFHVVESGSPDARYCVVDDSSGAWTVDFRSVPYDHSAAAAHAVANGRPDIAHALRTGRVPHAN